MHYVYVLVEKASQRRYIGFTSDLRRRMAQHACGRGAKSARSGSWKLAYYEAFANKRDAALRERRLKHDWRARYQLMKRIEGSFAGQE